MSAGQEQGQGLRRGRDAGHGLELLLELREAPGGSQPLLRADGEGRAADLEGDVRGGGDGGGHGVAFSVSEVWGPSWKGFRGEGRLASLWPGGSFFWKNPLSLLFLCFREGIEGYSERFFIFILVRAVKESEVLGAQRVERRCCCLLRGVAGIVRGAAWLRAFRLLRSN